MLWGGGEDPRVLRPLRGDRRIRGGRQFELGDGSLDSSGVWQAKKHGDKQSKLNISSMLGTDFQLKMLLVVMA